MVLNYKHLAYQVLWLFNINLATKKWIFLKISSVILLPLMFWFIINFVKVYDNEYLDVVKFFTNPVSKFLFSLFIIFAYFFSSLTISEVFEDYITDDKIKYVANRLLFISAIIIPLLTIIFLFNLN
jgi:succinate dehydrogenase / fumarate reductase membrane anchor subunit